MDACERKDTWISQKFGFGPSHEILPAIIASLNSGSHVVVNQTLLL
jgi:hypothetical protein